MKKPSFSEVVEALAGEDARYDEQAYHFMKEALDFTIKLLKKPVEGPGRHVRGEELLEGLRQYALQEFGPLSLRVLNSWGIKECRDFGQIVFNMVGRGILGKTEDDKIEDFAGGYSFEDAFRKPFLSKSPVNGNSSPAVKSRN